MRHETPWDSRQRESGDNGMNCYTLVHEIPDVTSSTVPQACEFACINDRLLTSYSCGEFVMHSITR